MYYHNYILNNVELQINTKPYEVNIIIYTMIDIDDLGNIIHKLYINYEEVIIYICRTYNVGLIITI